MAGGLTGGWDVTILGLARTAGRRRDWLAREGVATLNGRTVMDIGKCVGPVAVVPLLRQQAREVILVPRARAAGAVGHAVDRFPTDEPFDGRQPTARPVTGEGLCSRLPTFVKGIRARHSPSRVS